MMSRAAARITVETELNEDDREQDCVYAICAESEESVGPVWGTGEASRKRVLALLTEECGCGASFHYDEDSGEEA